MDDHSYNHNPNRFKLNMVN